jgi:hypothetical protein
MVIYGELERMGKQATMVHGTIAAFASKDLGN